MATTYNQVVLFGDSLFEQALQVKDGFSLQSALQFHCNRRLDVVNRGMSGWNTKHAIQYLPEIIPTQSGEPSPKIEYLVILLGANDAALEGSVGNNQGIPLDEYKENLKNIVNHEHVKAHDPRIFLITPPPLDQLGMEITDIANGHGQVTRHAERSAMYSQCVRDLAAELEHDGCNVKLLDLHKAIMDKALSITPNDADVPLGYPGGERGALAQLLPDGLHMNGDAYEILSGLIIENMTPFPEYPQGFVYPDWRTLVGIPLKQDS